MLFLNFNMIKNGTIVFHRHDQVKGLVKNCHDGFFEVEWEDGQFCDQCYYINLLEGLILNYDYVESFDKLISK